MKRIGIKDYKAFGTRKKIDFTNINIFIGPNGSGKSSLINALNLSKNILQLETENNYVPRNSSSKYSNIIDLFGSQHFFYSLKTILNNPHHELGKFSIKQIDKNNKSRFEISMPLKLKYFIDEFDLRLQYFITKEGVAKHISIEIYNVSLNKTLFLFSLIDMSKKKKEDLFRILNKDYSSLSIDELFDLNISIDFEYIDEYVKLASEGRLRNDEMVKKRRSPKFSEEDDDFPTYGEDEYREEYIKGMKPFSTEFYSADKCDLENYSTNNKYNSIIMDSDVFKYFNMIKDLNYFVCKQADDTRNILKINDQEIIESNFLSSIKNIKHEGYYLGDFPKKLNSYLSGEQKFIFFDFSNNDNLLDNVGFKQRREESNSSFEGTDKLDFYLNFLLFRNISSAFIDLFSELSNIIYIPPNRFKGYKSTSVSEEETLSFILKKLNIIISNGLLEEKFENFVNYWMDVFNLKNEKESYKIREILAMFENRFKDFQELGYGKNQIFPIICILAIFNSKNNSKEIYKSNIFNFDFSNMGNFIMIEEPEANLHPNFQSKLADLFIDSAWKFNHQFIIETHSEYMVRKFQYWVAKGKINSENINIYYFENKKNDSNNKDVFVKKININRDGSLSEPFGEGFYDEAIHWKFELLKLKNLN